MILPYSHAQIVHLASLFQKGIWERELAEEVKKPVENDKGYLGKLAPIERLKFHVRWVYGNTCALLQRVVSRANVTFEQHEQHGVKIISREMKNYIKIQDKYNSCMSAYTLFAIHVLEEASSCIPTRHSKDLNQELHRLKCNCVGMQYRLGLVNGGLNPDKFVNQAFYEKLEQAASLWKRNHPLFLDKCLNQLEKKQLEEASKYGEWEKVFEQSRTYQNEFFEWTLRDHNPPEIFIKCNHTRQLLKKAFLDKTIGRLHQAAHEMFKFIDIKTSKPGIKRRVLALVPYYHSATPINIFDSKTVIHLNGDKTQTLKDLFTEHIRQNERDPQTMFGSRGFVFFNPLKGNAETEKFRAVEQSESHWDWLYHIPSTDIYTNEQVRRRWGDIALNTAFVISVGANRSDNGSHGLLAGGCHSYIIICYKVGENEWNIVEMGKYLEQFPRTLLEKLSSLTSTAPGKFYMQDPSRNYTHRQRAEVPLVPTEEQADALVKAIYHGLFLKQGVFQLMGENCSEAIQNVVERAMGIGYVPDFFTIPIVRARTGLAFLDIPLKFLEDFPKWTIPRCIPYSSTLQARWVPFAKKIQRFTLRLFLFIMGSFRKLNVKGTTYSLHNRLANSSNINMKHPSRLFEAIGEAQQKRKDGSALTVQEEILATGRITFGAIQDKLLDNEDWKMTFAAGQGIV